MSTSFVIYTFLIVLILWQTYQMAKLVLEEIEEAKEEIIKAIKENGKLN